MTEVVGDIEQRVREILTKALSEPGLNDMAAILAISSDCQQIQALYSEVAPVPSYVQVSNLPATKIR